jgi:hypothetical protein
VHVQPVSMTLFDKIWDETTLPVFSFFFLPLCDVWVTLSSVSESEDSRLRLVADEKMQMKMCITVRGGDVMSQTG